MSRSIIVEQKARTIRIAYSLAPTTVHELPEQIARRDDRYAAPGQRSCDDALVADCGERVDNGESAKRLQTKQEVEAPFGVGGSAEDGMGHVGDDGIPVAVIAGFDVVELIEDEDAFQLGHRGVVDGVGEAGNG